MRQLPILPMDPAPAVRDAALGRGARIDGAVPPLVGEMVGWRLQGRVNAMSSYCLRTGGEVRQDDRLAHDETRSGSPAPQRIPNGATADRYEVPTTHEDEGGSRSVAETSVPVDGAWSAAEPSAPADGRPESCRWEKCGDVLRDLPTIEPSRLPAEIRDVEQERADRRDEDAAALRRASFPRGVKPRSRQRWFWQLKSPDAEREEIERLETTI